MVIEAICAGSFMSLYIGEFSHSIYGGFEDLN